MTFVFQEDKDYQVLTLTEESILFKQIENLPYQVIELADSNFKRIVGIDFKNVESSIMWNQVVLNYVSRLETEISIFES